MFALADNVVRAVMVESARVQEVAPERISLIDTIRWLIGVEGKGEDPSVVKVNPSRPGRVEPRVVKRRPKQYTRMTKPRSVLRKSLPAKGYSLSSRHSGHSEYRQLQIIAMSPFVPSSRKSFASMNAALSGRGVTQLVTLAKVGFAATQRTDRCSRARPWAWPSC